MSKYIEINGYRHLPYKHSVYSAKEAEQRSMAYYERLNRRRTVRDICSKSVPKRLIQNLIMTASTAPSGAHKQPWTFCAVANPEIKKKIRAAAEKEEYESYHGRMSDRWLKDLQPIGTDWNKPFLEEAPWLIVIFKRIYEMVNGERAKNYYVNESVGIACGVLLTAIHHAGLVTLTHTPSPMNFLAKILNRPENERPYLLFPVGYPRNNALVPALERKPLNEVAIFHE